MRNAQIVKATGIDHEQIRDPFAGVAQDILRAATAFDTTEGMLHSDSYASEGLVPTLLLGG
jgi:hypothetical protein